jgi:hypothetical protein
MWRTICQSYFPQPDYWTFRSQLQGPHGALLATDTFPGGVLFTMPPSLCSWYGHVKTTTLDRLQAQAASARTFRWAPKSFYTDPTCPSPSVPLGATLAQFPPVQSRRRRS